MVFIRTGLILFSISNTLLCRGSEYFGQTTVNNLISNVNDFIHLNPKDPRSNDKYLNITQLVRKYQYGIEEHTVRTEDGYVLSIHRILGRNMGKNNIVVFLMHGILDTSDSWVLQGPKNALAYILADKGFDVWMGNARGNKYSSSHITLTTNDSEFWKFTWEEIGVYDLPAMIDYVLNSTGKSDLYYVGHSQGTTCFYVLMSLKPAYNVKVKMMFSLAPVAWISHAKSPIIKLFTPTYGVLEYLTSSTEFLNKISKFTCSFLPIGCNNVMQLIIGNNYKFISASFLSVIYEHVPSGSSTLQFIHYGQLFKSGRFCRFDFGPRENLFKYGQVTPPDYDLRNVTVPVFLFYSDNDWLSDVTDVALLFNKLPNIHDSYNTGRFNHLDYMYANVAKDVIYEAIIQNIQDFELNND